MKTLFTCNKLVIGLSLTLICQLLSAQTSFCFKSKVNYSLGPDLTDMVARDLNNDGIIDLAVSNYGSSINLRRLMGLAGGTFSIAPNYSYTTNGAHGITAGTFGGGTTVQLALTNSYSNNASILANTGAGAFTFGTTLATGSFPSAIINNDFNNDGNLDLVVANSGTNTISVLKGISGGNFMTAVNYIVGNYPTSIASGDFNGDGNSDLVVSNYTSNNVSVLLGSGTGTFAAAINYGVGTNPYSVTTGDFNGDGKIDLAVANYNSNNLSVLMGSNTGTFSPAVNYAAGPSPRSIVSSDFNNDGFLDLACANFGSNNISILAGSAIGVFATADNFLTENSPLKIVTADFNGDGKADLATVNGNQTASILLNGEPTLSVNSGSICTGSAFTITPTGGSQYTFSGGSSVVSPITTTDYTITGCSSSNTIVCTVSVSPNPTLTANSGSICVGQTFTISPSGASTYTYALMLGTMTPTFTGSSLNLAPPTAGSYTIMIGGANSEGCNAANPVASIIDVSICTGIQQINANSNSVLIYPNPNNGEFTIQTQIEDIINLTNELGQVIETIELNQQNNFSYQVNDLGSGIYFLVGKMVKQKIVVTK